MAEGQKNSSRLIGVKQKLCIDSIVESTKDSLFYYKSMLL